MFRLTEAGHFVVDRLVNTPFPTNRIDQCAREIMDALTQGDAFQTSIRAQVKGKLGEKGVELVDGDFDSAFRKLVFVDIIVDGDAPVLQGTAEIWADAAGFNQIIWEGEGSYVRLNLGGASYVWIRQQHVCELDVHIYLKKPVIPESAVVALMTF